METVDEFNAKMRKGEELIRQEREWKALEVILEDPSKEPFLITYCANLFSENKDRHGEIAGRFHTLASCNITPFAKKVLNAFTSIYSVPKGSVDSVDDEFTTVIRMSIKS